MGIEIRSSQQGPQAQEDGERLDPLQQLVERLRRLTNHGSWIESQPERDELRPKLMQAIQILGIHELHLGGLHSGFQA